MYYVVYLKSLHRNVIVPCNWVNNDTDHNEKHMNYGLNSSQTFICFYTSNPDAFEAENRPKIDFEPNFDAMFNNVNGDGLFACKLKTFRSECIKNIFMPNILAFWCIFSENIEAALGDLYRFRNIEPPIYNENRLKERPIPEQIDGDTFPEDAESLHESVDNGDESNDNESLESVADMVQNDLPNASDVLNANNNLTGDMDDTHNELIGDQDGFNLPEVENALNVSGETTEDPLAFETIDVKPNLVPLYEHHVANQNNILAQLHEPDIIEDDDVIIIVGSKGFAMPLNATPDGLIKREQLDIISGDMPFNMTVSICYF